MPARNPDVTTTADLDAALASEALQPLAKHRGEPVFRDSWEAEAYAIGTILVREGFLSCKQWMDLLVAAIQEAQAAGDPDTGETYYDHWCRALESFCFENAMISPEDYAELLQRWGEAIANTPHGVPLAIENASMAPFHPGATDAHGHHHHHGHDHGQAHFHGHSHAHAHPDPPSAPPEHYWRPIHVTRLGGEKSPANAAGF